MKNGTQDDLLDIGHLRLWVDGERHRESRDSRVLRLSAPGLRDKVVQFTLEYHVRQIYVGQIE